MHSRNYLVGSVLVLSLAACNLTQIPARAPVTPVIMTNTPVPTDTVENIPIPTPLDMPLVSSPALIHITFVDANSGWGVASNNSGYILRTMDGGTTWLDATPPGLSGIGYSTYFYALNVNLAWVLVPNADYFTGTLYRTSDGGVSWSSYAVPFGGGFIQFLDASTGRVLADRGAGAGSQSVEMFQTSDGGETWLSVFNNDPTRPDSSGSLPLSGIKNGMTVLDANNGWVTGTVPMDGYIYLYVTHDGGISWEQQSIPLPAGYETYMYTPQAPIFFGNDGVLPLIIYRSNTPDFTFFSTHDGGVTWSGDPKNTNKVIMPGIYSFADAMHGWSWDGGTTLYFTADTAQTWGGISTNIGLSGRLSQLVFIPETPGKFTGWALTSVDDSGQSQLYKTTDQGGTWNLVNP